MYGGGRSGGRRWFGRGGGGGEGEVRCGVVGCNGSSAQAQAAGALVPLKQPLADGAANGTDGTAGAGAGAGAGAAILSFGTGVSGLSCLALSWALHCF